jgi:hypothetical protein
MMDIRYIWSAMLSPLRIPKRRQPSRLLVLRRERRWKKGRGEGVRGARGWGRVRRTVEGGQFVVSAGGREGTAPVSGIQISLLVVVEVVVLRLASDVAPEGDL